MSAQSEQYAVALFELARETDVITEIEKTFASFLKSFDKQSRDFFTHPNIKRYDKKAAVKAVGLPTLFQDFLLVVVENGRVDILDKMYKDYKHLIDKMHKKMHIVVKSKKTLQKSRIEQLKTQFEKKYSRKVTIENQVDESIVGGLRFEFEGKVIDDTINHNLATLRRQLTK